MPASSDLKKRYGNADPTALRNVLVLGWRIVLIVLCILLIVSFVFGAWMLWGVLGGDESAAANVKGSEASIPVSAADLDKILTVFDQRGEHFQTILREGVAATDPSR